MGIKRLPDREAIQRALNACAARHAGINAAAVDAGSGRPGLYRRRNQNRASVGEGEVGPPPCHAAGLVSRIPCRAAGLALHIM